MFLLKFEFLIVNFKEFKFQSGNNLLATFCADVAVADFQDRRKVKK